MLFFTDSFNRTGFEGRLTGLFFFRSGWLLENVGITMRIIARVVAWSLRSAGITVDTLVVYEKFAGHVVFPLFIFVRHRRFHLK